MSELTQALQRHGQHHQGTDLGGLLQWVALHIQSQDEALTELRDEVEILTADASKYRSALQQLSEVLHACQRFANMQAHEIDPELFGRDMVPHINLMAGHGDPDYLKTNGNSVRHIDCRQSSPRKKKAAA